MRYLNRVFLLKRGILLGEKNYTYRSKSLLFKKLYSNFIFDFNQSSFYLKKALKIVSDITRIRGTVLVYCRNLTIYDFNLINISKINPRIIFISEKWVPGTINNFLTRSQLNIELIPDLVIILNKSIIENAIVLGEATCLSIPCILLVSTGFKFDLISYPIWGNNFNPSTIKLLLSFFYNSILSGLFNEKSFDIKNKIKLNKKNVKKNNAKI